MDKIKAFFSNKVVKIVSWVLLAVSAVVLLLGGVTSVEIAEGVDLIGKIIVAITALVIFISEKVTKKK